MTRKQFEELKTDYILGKLGEEQLRAVEQFLLDHPKLINELDEFKKLLDFDEVSIPKTSEERMDATFYKFLNQQKARVETKRKFIFEKLGALLRANNWQSKLVYGLAILAIGFFVGNRLNFESTPNNQEENYANAETEKVRSQLVLELIEQPSANKRLKAVNEASKLNDATEQVIKALFITLNNDENVNVRLAAIESLMRYSDKAIVREGLIKSITNQDSPLVQVALADVMVSLQDKNSINPLKELLNQPNVDSAVKQKIDATIKEII
ncbi:MAG: HEAT repeat domain-containing protein [Flavobacteriaceae bacterium]|nr:HEAT repeat domain-containing protein [Flavobacteriaceae bacterium]